MKLIILLGLSCSGKTTTADYISRKYNLRYLHLRREFEKCVGKNNAPLVYHRDCINKKDGCVQWLHAIESIFTYLKEDEFLLVEGITSKMELQWIENHINDSIIPIYLKSSDRLNRFMDRYQLDEEGARRRMAESDAWKIENNILELEKISTFIIKNDIEDRNILYESLDDVMSQILSMPALSALCYHVNKKSFYGFSPVSISYFIRQLGIAHGCRNACSHCFADSPYEVVQTELSGFSRIIKEIGQAVEIENRPLKFFHLGASTDPAMVNNYAAYLRAWIMAMPQFQTIKIFTHGWNLKHPNGYRELENTLIYISTQTSRNIRMVISFDCFSIFARSDWDGYITNIVDNLQRMLKVLPKDKIRIEVFYPPERALATEAILLETWRELAKRGTTYKWSEVLEVLNGIEDTHPTCKKITGGVFTVFEKCDLLFEDLVAMTRDCNMIFYSGRGTAFFKDNLVDLIPDGLKIQKERVLYSLQDYEFGYNGIVIYPDGTGRFVDYEGYVLGEWLNDGRSVIKCMQLKNVCL